MALNSPDPLKISRLSKNILIAKLPNRNCNNVVLFVTISVVIDGSRDCRRRSRRGMYRK